MSDVTALEHGQLSLPDFIVKVAGEIAANPFTKLLAPLLLQLLQMELAALFKSSTAAALVVNDIEAVIAGKPSALATQAEAGAVAALTSWISGQSGSATGQAVEQAAEAAAAAA